MEPRFTEKYFSQTLDHFNFNSMGNGTFNQRYLITGEAYFLLQMLQKRICEWKADCDLLFSAVR